MKVNAVTETFVRKLKEDARQRAKESGKTSSFHRDEIAREAGYQDYRHVQKRLAAWRETERQTGKSRFRNLAPVLNSIIVFLAENYRHELAEAERRYIRAIGENLPWPDDGDQSLEDKILRLAWWEFIVAEGSFQMGGTMVRIGDLVLDQMKGLDAVQRHYLRELCATKLGIYMVSRVVDQETIVVVDALDVDARQIEVAFPAKPGRTYEGMVAAMRLLQPHTYPYCNDLVMPFHPARFSSVTEAVGNADPNAPADTESAVSVSVLRAFIEDSFGPPRVGSAISVDGELLIFVTHRYRVNDPEALLECLCRAPSVNRTGPMAFFYYGQRDGGSMPIGEVYLDPQSPYVALRSTSSCSAVQAKAWFENTAGQSVSFLYSESQTPDEMLEGTTEEEMRQHFAEQREAIPADLQSEIYQKFILDHFRNWADEPLPAFDGLTPRAMCGRRGGVDRVRAMIEFYEKSEQAMAARMGRPIVSYEFLWQQVGLTR